MKNIVFSISLLFMVLAVSYARTTDSKSNNDSPISETTFLNRSIECYYEPCPKGWSKASWSTCFLIRPTQKNQRDAELDCLTLGSTLALVESDSERNFMNALAMRDAPVTTGLWLGTIRRGEFWFNSDLSRFTYESWAPGQPDFTLGNCVFLNDNAAELNDPYWGRMRMTACDRLLNYACEKDQYSYDKLVCGPRD